jgi:hypothetical protein
MTLPRANARPRRPSHHDRNSTVSEQSSDAGLAAGTVAAPDLSVLDQRRVAISLNTQGRTCLLQGQAAYAPDDRLGGILKVAVDDPREPLEFLFINGQWGGTIESGEAVGCDYLMHVG